MNLDLIILWVALSIVLYFVFEYLIKKKIAIAIDKYCIKRFIKRVEDGSLIMPPDEIKLLAKHLFVNFRMYLRSINEIDDDNKPEGDENA